MYLINQDLNFKITFYYLEVYNIRFFILMQNKRFIYFVNSITCKSKSKFVILIFFLLLYQNHNK